MPITKLNYRPSAEKIEELQVVFDASYNQGFAAVTPTFNLFSRVSTITQKGVQRAWISQEDALREFVDERVIKQINVNGSRIEVKKFEKTVGLSYDDISDNQWSQSVLVAEGIGKSAARHKDLLCYGVLTQNAICVDDKPLFADDHFSNMFDNTKGVYSNQILDQDNPTAPFWYLTKDNMGVELFIREGEDLSFGMLDGDQGFMKEQLLFGVRGRMVAAGGLPQFIGRSNMPLTAENYEALRSKIEAINGVDGAPIDNSPSTLIVPKRLRAAAKLVIEADRNASGATNIYLNDVNVIVSHYLG